MTTWADVSKGDRIELRGATYTVGKIKRIASNPKRATVTVVGTAGKFKADVKLKDAVTLAKARRGAKGDDDGWYKPTKADKKAERSRAAMPAGDPTVTTPPAKPSADPWESRRDKVERKLEALLEARLVGESNDEWVGYYVPPVAADTVAAHWMIFHEGDDWQEVGEAELMRRHERDHLPGDDLPLKVNHWHTETRPKAGKK